MKKIKIDRQLFYRLIHKEFDTRIATHVMMEVLDKSIIKPKCIDAVCDDDHNWKYTNGNEDRKCKWCGEKQTIARGEWILREHCF